MPLSVMVHQLFDSHFIEFCSVFFNLLLFDYPMFRCSFTQCYFLSWYWNCIPGISILQITQQQSSGKPINSYIRLHHLCLSVGSWGPITVIDIVRYPEPISPNGLAEGETLAPSFPPAPWDPISRDARILTSKHVSCKHICMHRSSAPPQGVSGVAALVPGQWRGPLRGHAAVCNGFNWLNKNCWWPTQGIYQSCFKGTVARDCRPLVFFMNWPHMGLWFTP
jgi:hypothetical protein